jgi:hypothetical protein
VRHNALKHGLLSREVLLQGEDEVAFVDLSERLRAELQPIGELENLLVDRIIAAQWRLRRLGRVEAGIFTWQHYEELAERAQEEARSYERDRQLEDLMKSVGIMVTDEQKHKDALSKAEEIRAKQDAETAMLGRTFMRDASDANAFSKLSRYETAIERSLYKALHELQRLQTARHAGGSVSPPLAVDVEVSRGSR